MRFGTPVKPPERSARPSKSRPSSRSPGCASSLARPAEGRSVAEAGFAPAFSGNEPERILLPHPAVTLASRGACHFALLPVGGGTPSVPTSMHPSGWGVQGRLSRRASRTWGTGWRPAEWWPLAVAGRGLAIGGYRASASERGSGTPTSSRRPTPDPITQARTTAHPRFVRFPPWPGDAW